MTSVIILALITFLVPPQHQKKRETIVEAKARYAVIAKAISAEAGADKTLALFLLSVARHESAFRRDIHTGTRRGDGGRSWGLFQIMCGPTTRSPVPMPFSRGTIYRAGQIVGVDYASTRRAAHASAIWLRRHIRRCNGKAMCVFKSYAGTSLTHTPTMRKKLAARVKTYRALVQRIK